MARAHPSLEELRKLGAQVADAAAMARGIHELKFAPEGSPAAGGPPDDSIAGEKYGTGADGRVLGTHEDWSRLRLGYAWIPELFVSLAGPEPGHLDGLIETMESAWKALYDRDSGADPVGTHIRQAESHLSGWSGVAAETFRTNFLHKIPDSVKSQAQLAFMLQHAALADQDVWVETRLNLRDLAEKTTTALESLDDCGGTDSLITILTVIGIVVSVVALWEVAAVACTIVASSVAAASLVADKAGESAVEAEVAGDTVETVLQNMVNATDVLRSQIYWSERKITDALRENLDLVHDTTHFHGATSTHDAFLPPRPALVGESMIPSIIRNDFRPG
jgi:hypothetical protein